MTNRREPQADRDARLLAATGTIWVLNVVPLPMARRVARAYLRLRKKHATRSKVK